MLRLDNTVPPHLGQKIIYQGASIEDASSAMILLHGRGADAESMRGLIPELYVDGMMYTIPEATNFTWYPLRFIETRKANEPHLTSALTLIDSIVKALNNNNIPSERIYLLGFSQGACLAADYAARFPSRFGGVFALSGGLIGENLSASDYYGDMKRTPVFFGCSEKDSHIPEERIHESVTIFENLNADVTEKIYLFMGHTINKDELAVIKKALPQEKFIRES